MASPTQTATFRIGFGNQINDLIAQLNEAGIAADLVTKTQGLFTSILSEAVRIHEEGVRRAITALTKSVGRYAELNNKHAELNNKYIALCTECIGLQARYIELQLLFGASQSSLLENSATIQGLRDRVAELENLP